MQDSEKGETDYLHGVLCLNSDYQIGKRHAHYAKITINHKPFDLVWHLKVKEESYWQPLDDWCFPDSEKKTSRAITVWVRVVFDRITIIAIYDLNMDCGMSLVSMSKEFPLYQQIYALPTVKWNMLMDTKFAWFSLNNQIHMK